VNFLDAFTGFDHISQLFSDAQQTTLSIAPALQAPPIVIGSAGLVFFRTLPRLFAHSKWLRFVPVVLDYFQQLGYDYPFVAHPLFNRVLLGLLTTVCANSSSLERNGYFHTFCRRFVSSILRTIVFRVMCYAASRFLAVTFGAYKDFSVGFLRSLSLKHTVVPVGVEDDNVPLILPPAISYSHDSVVSVFLDKAQEYADANGCNGVQYRGLWNYDYNSDTLDWSDMSTYTPVTDAVQACVFTDLTIHDWPRHLAMSPSDHHLLLTVNPYRPSGKFTLAEKDIRYWIDGNVCKLDAGTQHVTEGRIYRYEGNLQCVCTSLYVCIFQVSVYESYAPDLRVVQVRRVWWGHRLHPRTWFVAPRLKDVGRAIVPYSFRCCSDSSCSRYTIVETSDTVSVKGPGSTYCTVARYQFDVIRAWVEAHDAKKLNNWQLAQLCGRKDADLSIMLAYVKTCPAVVRYQPEHVTETVDQCWHTVSLLRSGTKPGAPSLSTLASPFLDNYTIPLRDESNMRQAAEIRVQQPQFRRRHRQQRVKKSHPHLERIVGMAYAGLLRHVKPSLPLTPLDASELMEKAEGPSQESTYQRSFQYLERDGAPEALKAFMKAEPYIVKFDDESGTTGKCRHITTMPVGVYATMAHFWYPLCTHLYGKGGRLAKCYAFSKTPRELAEQMAAIYSGGRTGVFGDFSSWDGHMPHVLARLECDTFLQCFATKHHGKINAMFKVAIYGALTRAYQELAFLQIAATKSGKHPTSGMNTFSIIFILLVALLYTIPSWSVQEALKFIIENALIGGDDWNCATPPGTTAEAFADNLVLVSELFGQSLELECYSGDGNIAFLSRQFVNLGAGDPTTCADVARALGKLHLSCLPADAKPHVRWTRLVEKAYAYTLTDGNTPVLGPLCNLIVDTHNQLVEKPGVLSVYSGKINPISLEGLQRGEIGWWALQVPDKTKQWPNQRSDQMNAVAYSSLDPLLAWGAFEEHLAKLREQLDQERLVDGYNPPSGLYVHEALTKFPNFSTRHGPTRSKAGDTVLVTDALTGEVRILSKFSYRIDLRTDPQGRWVCHVNKTINTDQGEIPAGSAGRARSPLVAIKSALNTSANKVVTGDSISRLRNILYHCAAVDFHVATVDEVPLEDIPTLDDRAFNVWYFTPTHCLATWPATDPELAEFDVRAALAKVKHFSEIFTTPMEAVQGVAQLIKPEPTSEAQTDVPTLLGDEPCDLEQEFGKPNKAPVLKLRGDKDHLEGCGRAPLTRGGKANRQRLASKAINTKRKGGSRGKTKPTKA